MPVRVERRPICLPMGRVRTVSAQSRQPRFDPMALSKNPSLCAKSCYIRVRPRGFPKIPHWICGHGADMKTFNRIAIFI